MTTDTPAPETPVLTPERLDALWQAIRTTLKPYVRVDRAVLATLLSAAREVESLREQRDRWYGKAIQRATADDERDAAVKRAESAEAAVARLTYEAESRQEAYNEVFDKSRCFEADAARLRTWVSDLQSGMFVNCVYCGHRYGPGETTPVSMADALTAQHEQCPDHPMSRIKADAVRLREAAQAAAARLDESRLRNPPIMDATAILYSALATREGA